MTTTREATPDAALELAADAETVAKAAKVAADDAGYNAVKALERTNRLQQHCDELDAELRYLADRLASLESGTQRSTSTPRLTGGVWIVGPAAAAVRLGWREDAFRLAYKRRRIEHEQSVGVLPAWPEPALLDWAAQFSPGAVAGGRA